MEPGTADAQKRQDSLSDFARGYLEAAFFCGIQDIEGDDTESAVSDLAPEAFDSLVAGAVRWRIENAADLERATAGGAYDLEQAGRDFWFTRNRHGVGFWDRKLGEAGDALTESARAAGECDLGFGDDGLIYCYNGGAPLTPAELEAAESLDGKPGDDLTDVGGRYGAPMGRGSEHLELGDTVHLHRVTLDPGGYDAGGAYWGLGAPLWRAVATDGAREFIRAGNRDAARADLAGRGILAW
ncbi:MAG: hypothetical protein WC130_11295 [Kiritimatiellia bacterium]